MIKAGKRTKEWTAARAKAKKVFEAKGITSCEIRLAGCWKNNALGFAHRHKRDWYYSEGRKGELLGDFNHIIVACGPCHQKIEHNRELTLSIFKTLRG